MSDDFEDRTEEPSQKKLDDARQKGRVAKSQEFTSAVLLFAAMLVLYFSAGFLYTQLEELFVGVFDNINATELTNGIVIEWFQQGLFWMIKIMLPMLLSLFVVSVITNASQVGLVFSLQPLSPKWGNVNIFDPSKYKKMFSSSAFVKLIVGLAKLTVICIITTVIIMGVAPEISNLMKAQVAEIYAFTCYQAYLIGIWSAVLLVMVGLMDYGFQRHKFGQEMRMTRQELKDERKQSEGDAQVKGRMRSMMQSFSRNRMKTNVPKANVIIANPIHFAIALQYDAETMAAPVCLAKGARKMALAIKEIAKENNIPIVENPPLAQALYKTVEVGSPVPPQFYHAIAEVLAYVYRLNEKLGSL